MIVHIVCGYRSKSDDWTDDWTNQHFRARNLVKAIKHEEFNGRSSWSDSKTKREYIVRNTPAGREAALFIGANLLLKRLTEAGVNGASIVPVPSSQHVTPGEEFTGSRVAEAMQKIMPAFVSRPELYFDQVMPKTRNGGSRKAHQIIPHLRAANLANLGSVILFDDVMTTGGHLRAGARFLRAQGVNVVAAAVVGRTIWAPVENMFVMPAQDLDC